jgi:hypothetical protein
LRPVDATYNECGHWSIQTLRIKDELLGFDDLPRLLDEFKISLTFCCDVKCGDGEGQIVLVRVVHASRAGREWEWARVVTESRSGRSSPV